MKKILDYLSTVHPAFPVTMLMLIAVLSFSLIFRITGFGINPTEKDMDYGMAFVKTNDGGGYWVTFTQPSKPIVIKRKNKGEIWNNPRVLWVDTAGKFTDPRMLKLALELGKSPHNM